METAAVIQFRKTQESAFICSACGADRSCNCNAPALERAATQRELNRQRQARHKAKKRKEKQQIGNVTVEDDLEADEYREAFLLRTADAMAFAVYSGEIDDEVIAAARRVAAKWEAFIKILEASYGKKT